MVDRELRFHVLGALLVTRAGSPVDLPRSAVLRGLLGMLLLADAEPLAASRLGRAVWSEPYGVSRGAVQVGVSRLRAWLRRADGGDGAPAIEHTGEGYRLWIPSDAGG